MFKSSHESFRLFVSWNISIVVFFLFCFLVIVVLLILVLLLVAVISFSLLFLKSSLRVFISMNRYYLQRWRVLFLLFVNSFSMSSLGCKALSIVISLLALWSICWRFSLFHFRNGPEYLKRRTAQVFIHFIRFLPYTLVSSSFLVLLKYSFLIFSFCSLLMMILIKIIIIIIIIQTDAVISDTNRFISFCLQFFPIRGKRYKS